MQELASNLLGPVTTIFAVASMLNVGLSYTLEEILGPLSNIKSVLLALLANFVLAPLLAWGIAELLSLDQPYRIGLLVVSTAAGAPFLVKLVQLSNGSVAYAASLLVLLLPLTIVYMPIVLPQIIPGADVGVWEIAQPLLLTMLLPLAIGMLVHAKWPDPGEAIRPYLGPIANLAIVLLLLFTAISQWETITDVFGEGILLAGVLFIAGCFVIGYLCSSGEYRDETGFATAQRNMAAANVVAINVIGQSDTIVAVVVVSFMAMLVLFPLAPVMSRLHGDGEQVAAT